MSINTNIDIIIFNMISLKIVTIQFKRFRFTDVDLYGSVRQYRLLFSILSVTRNILIT